MIKVPDCRRFWPALALILCVWPARGGDRPPASFQEDEIRSIRELYTRTNESIRLAQAKKTGEGGPLYCNEVVTNRYDASWRAVGNYSRKAAFWYSDQPDFARYENLQEEAVLVKVEIEEVAAVRSVAEEYLFDKGELVFYYRKSKAGGSAPGEERLYFRDKKMIRRLGQPAEEGFEPSDPAATLSRARSLQKSFLATFDR
jgi:hypothetical protein